MNIISSFLLTIFLLFNLQLVSAFVVKDIQVKGLQNIKQETFLALLPVKVNDEFDSEESSKVITRLYNTKLFNNIKISKIGDTLVFKVVERQIIASVSVKGNDDINSTKMNEILKSQGIIKGQRFDEANVVLLVASLKEQYIIQGKNSVDVEYTVEQLPSNRVKLNITIDEGENSQFRSIKFVGNNNVSSSKLLGSLPISKRELFSFMTQNHKYSKEKITNSLEIIKEIYNDLGYAKAVVKSHNISKSPVNNHVNTVFVIEEGLVYRLNEVNLAGNLVVPKEELMKYISVKKGERYSKSKLLKISMKIVNYLGDKGYTFSKVEPKEQFNDEKNEVDITFYVTPGRSMYLRRLIFTGNHKTSEISLRKLFLQKEGALVSNSKIAESLRKINNLRYITSAKVASREVVLGTNNQMDIVIAIEESIMADLQAQIGFSSNGVQIMAGINAYNLLGEGKSGGVNFKYDRSGIGVSLDYSNPFFTDSGIRQSSSVYWRKTTFQRVDNDKKTPDNSGVPGLNVVQPKSLYSSYGMNSLGFTHNYGIPISNNLQLSLGMHLSHKDIIKTDPNKPLVLQYQNYVNKYGDKYTLADIQSGITYESLDRFPFPNSGIKFDTTAAISVPLVKHGRYYTLSSELQIYRELYREFVLGIGMTVKYVNSYSSKERPPFFAFYHAGGAVPEGQVRGYESGSLGPVDANNTVMGGNLLLNGTVALYFPEPISGTSYRVSAFYDVGNTYQTYSNIDGTQAGRYLGTHRVRRLRHSIGIAGEWLTPFGPIKLSFAWALNADKNDITTIPALSFMTGI